MPLVLVVVVVVLELCHTLPMLQLQMSTARLLNQIRLQEETNMGIERAACSKLVLVLLLLQLRLAPYRAVGVAEVLGQLSIARKTKKTWRLQMK